MNFSIEKKRDLETLNEITCFSGEITSVDLLNLRLSAFDRALLNEVMNDEKPKAHDFLLCLEMLYRKYYEQTKNND